MVYNTLTVDNYLIHPHYKIPKLTPKCFDILFAHLALIYNTGLDLCHLPYINGTWQMNCHKNKSVNNPELLRV